MNMKEMTEKMKRAGSLVGTYNLTDEELAECLDCSKLVLAFLDNAGPKWYLASVPMRGIVTELEGFVESRKSYDR